MAVGYTYFSNAAFGGSPGTTVTANLGGTASAGDIIIVNAVGGVDGSGLGLPTIIGGGAAPTWIKIFDDDHSLIADANKEYRETLWYCICLGGENQVFGVWPGSSNKGIQCLWISNPGGLNQVYVMGYAHEGTSSGGHWITPNYNPATNGEIYVGFTANGRDAYTFADMNVNGGGADTGDGFSLGGAPKAIMHHHANTHTHVTTDNVAYGCNDTIPSVTIGVMGVRVAATSVDYTDAATVTLVAVESAVEYTDGGFVPQQFIVGDTSPASYVRSGRENVITVTTSDFDATFLVQVSDDGETWYDYYTEEGVTFNIDTGTARTLPPGVFHFRLKCNGADDGPATCTIGYEGGY